MPEIIPAVNELRKIYRISIYNTDKYATTERAQGFLKKLAAYPAILAACPAGISRSGMISDALRYYHGDVIGNGISIADVGRLLLQQQDTGSFIYRTIPVRTLIVMGLTHPTDTMYIHEILQPLNNIPGFNLIAIPGREDAIEGLIRRAEVPLPYL
jgi:hypothetical protein